jgi:hypothetical protein
MSMHADEESDEGVLPMKRSNNEGVASAETGEGRTSRRRDSLPMRISASWFGSLGSTAYKDVARLIRVPEKRAPL